ncbi:MAG TPA: sigma-70 family RNA polymerase sigma factor [Parapedobacter sp.]|uniref:RNA polymerase sigma factor n=1 Tax=Parapedobacter sp. TaxID=1958893 RepID=UPI002CBF3067|nr:sigma-70 family RNA polymerase sigma factor [Parapedobacter sp.]HWK57421.1 sigma-70 family RNA polymerase sigma factor [Parapedobacter sp.]
MPTLIENEQQLIGEIARGNEKVLEDLYVSNKAKFLGYAKGMLQDSAALEDIYQDAIIAFYENVRVGKVTTLKSSISTYIISIGKFMLFRYLRNRKMTTHLKAFEDQELDRVFSDYIETISDEDETIKFFQNAIDKLGEPCATLLKLFYYEDKGNTDIMELLGYANTDVVKSQKYRCMQSLKLIVKKLYRNA